MRSREHVSIVAFSAHLIASRLTLRNSHALIMVHLAESRLLLAHMDHNRNDVLAAAARVLRASLPAHNAVPAPLGPLPAHRFRRPQPDGRIKGTGRNGAARSTARRHEEGARGGRLGRVQCPACGGAAGRAGVACYRCAEDEEPAVDQGESLELEPFAESVVAV